MPLATLLTEVQKIIQTPGLTIVTHELDMGMSRQIYTDGRALPKQIEFPSWLGYSVGRWEGDTFVVDTIGFNDRGWLDMRGHPRSEAMHVTERYRRPDVGHLHVEMTFDDPQFYSRPFTLAECWNQRDRRATDEVVKNPAPPPTFAHACRTAA